MMAHTKNIIKYPRSARFYGQILIIALCLFSTVSKSQNVHGLYIAKNNLCSASLLLLPGGLSYYEGGCEERSTIFKGAYQVSKDSIKFFTSGPPSISYKILTTKSSPEDKKIVKLIDVEGKPLAFFNVFTLSYPVIGDTLDNINHLLTDKNGVFSLEGLQESYISFDRFNPKRINKENKFKWERLSALDGTTITIQFYYPAFCLRYPEVQVLSGLPTLKRIAGQDALIDDQHNIYRKRKTNH